MCIKSSPNIGNYKARNFYCMLNLDIWSGIFYQLFLLFFLFKFISGEDQSPECSRIGGDG